MDVVTHSAAETRSLAASVSHLLRGGDVVALSGDLGSGKTTFAQGVAEGLGVTEPVVSPTFTIVRQYEGRLPLLHLDVYRLDHLQELHDLGFDELVDAAVVTLVEWGDVVSALLPADRLEIRLDPGDADDERVVRFDARGASWDGRADALAALAGPQVARPADDGGR